MLIISEAIKNNLKTIPWLYGLSARCKALLTNARYVKTVSYYTEKEQHRSFSTLLANRAGNRIKRLQGLSRLNIFFLGTDEQQDRGGILQALTRYGNLACFTRTDGSYGQNYPGSVSERRASNTERLLHLFQERKDQDKTPDLLIAQTWASFADPKAFSYIRETYGTIVVNIAMDDRHQYWGHKLNGGWGGTYGLIPHIDLALTAAPECVEWYLKEGCPAIFFPEASDPAIFYPMPESPKIYDVSFVGGRYGIREQIVLALRKAGISVTAYGVGWENGRIVTEDVPKLFAQSKIILGIGTIGHCCDFYALKMRDFDGPMAGSCYLTHDNPDLHALYEVGKEIVTYRDINECVEKVKYYLEHDSEREQIANAGYESASRDHTWDKRFGDIVRLLTGASD